MKKKKIKTLDDLVRDLPLDNLTLDYLRKRDRDIRDRWKQDQNPFSQSEQIWGHNIRRKSFDKKVKAKSGSSVFVPKIIELMVIDQIRHSTTSIPSKLSFPSRSESIKLSKYREYIQVLSDKELKIEVFEADETWKLVEVRKEWKRRKD